MEKIKIQNLQNRAEVRYENILTGKIWILVRKSTSIKTIFKVLNGLSLFSYLPPSLSLSLSPPLSLSLSLLSLE